jgi:hypothetical protein
MIHSDQVGEHDIENLGLTDEQAAREPPATWAQTAGSHVEKTVAFRNNGKAGERFTVDVWGLDPEWLTVVQRTDALEPGGLGRATVALAVPPYLVAGDYPFTIRVRAAAAERYWLGDTRQYVLRVSNDGTAYGLALGDWNLRQGILAPVKYMVAACVPGSSMPLEFSVTNKGTGLDRFQVELEGIRKEWVQLPQVKDIEPGGKSDCRIVVAFPKGAEPGEYAYTIKVRSVIQPKVFEQQEGFITLWRATKEQIERGVEEYRKTLTAGAEGEQ